jgi:uncharacterized protein
MSKLTVRFTFYVVGLIILSLGVSLTIKADLGAGAWDALNVGLSKSVGLTVGNWVFIIGIFLIFVNAFLYQRKPNFVSVLTILIVGFFIDFWLLVVLKDVHASGDFFTQNLLLLFGIIILPVGIAIYLEGNIAPNPVDQLMLAISFRFNVSFMVAKTIGELLALVFAWLLEGPIGIGTIIITLLIGPLVQITIPLVKRISNNKYLL